MEESACVIREWISSLCLSLLLVILFVLSYTPQRVRVQVRREPKKIHVVPLSLSVTKKEQAPPPRNKKMKKAAPTSIYSRSLEGRNVVQSTLKRAPPPPTSCDWDDVDAAAPPKNNNTTVFHEAEDGLEMSDEFLELSIGSVEKRLAMDADPLMEQVTFASEANFNDATIMASGDQTIGAYFGTRSQYPPGDVRDSLRQWKYECQSKAEERLSQVNRMSTDPRESITAFFLGAKSDGIDKRGIIDSVMKYCVEKQANEKMQMEMQQVQQRKEPVPEQSPPRHRIEERYSEGVGIMDITAISQAPSSPPYSPPHSTPKRKSGVDFHGAQTSRASSKDGRNSVRLFNNDQRQRNNEEEPRRSKSYRATEVQGKPNPPQKPEPSPNSSISSTGTSVSHAGTQASSTVEIMGPLQIYRSNSTTSINLPASSNNNQNHNAPIIIQVQCPCSHSGKHAHEGRSDAVQAQPAPVQVPTQAPPHNVHPVPHPRLSNSYQPVPVMVPFTMMPMPMMYMPMGMGVPMPSSNQQFQPHQSHHQSQAPQNTQCQCRCNSCHN